MPKSAAAILFASLLARCSGVAAAEANPESPPEPKIYRDKVEPHWFAGNNKFWYRLALPNAAREFIKVDLITGTRAPAFDHEAVAEAMSRKTGSTFRANQLPVESIRFPEKEDFVQLLGEKQAWKWDFHELTEETRDATETSPPPAPPERTRPRAPSTKSPDGRWEAVVRGDNLFLRNSTNSEEKALSYDANPTQSYVRDRQRERSVDMRYDLAETNPPSPEVYWSPDSGRLVAMRSRPGTQRTVYLVESSPRDQVQPKLQSYPYLKPGDELPLRIPRLFEAGTGREVQISNQLFSNPWSITDLRWHRDSSEFTFLYNQRGHQVLRIVAVDAQTGTARSVVEEKSETFIDYSGKFFAEYLDGTGEIIWLSERDGWNHLYLYDAAAGRVKNQITKGAWVVRRVERVDKDHRQVWFRANGLDPAQDPYYIHLCRVNFDGSGMTVLTSGDGTHSVQFAPDRRHFLDTWSRVDLPPVTELRQSSDGKLICRLEETDASELWKSGWRPPERFIAKARDGQTEIYGILHRPRVVDPTGKYPIVESIYAGPHDSFVPKAFRSSYPQEKLTKRGFFVAQIDGMGTSNRSKKFHDVCWKNIGDAGFPDRILWIKAAALKYPWIDLDRVGIYGTSAGGQNALRALLAHGDFYKAGVADSGCHDNRMDKIWWNEQWMGWPVGPHYDEQSNVTQAHQLQGKLLLMAGELDKNVDPASTMQVVNQLVKANKEFELLIIPGAGHGVARTPYGWRRLEDFFVRHLGTAAPSSGDTRRDASQSIF